jgi:hypothetical protein
VSEQLTTGRVCDGLHVLGQDKTDDIKVEWAVRIRSFSQEESGIVV